ncbi:MAG: hypothetical protein WEC76_00760 [Steroidobacteraceae bacterium]
MLESAAVKTLPHAAFKILVLLAAQFLGDNNGTMAMTELYARRFGFKGRNTIYRSLVELEARGLIVQTRRGVKSKTHFSLYALNWRPINNHNGQPLAVPQMPSRSWQSWTCESFPAVGNDAKNLQPHGGESSLPTMGNDEPGYVPIPAENGPGSFPMVGNTSRILERGERGRPERTRARPLTETPSAPQADAVAGPQHVGDAIANWASKL